MPFLPKSLTRAIPYSSGLKFSLYLAGPIQADPIKSQSPIHRVLDSNIQKPQNQED